MLLTIHIYKLHYVCSLLFHTGFLVMFELTTCKNKMPVRHWRWRWCIEWHFDFTRRDHTHCSFPCEYIFSSYRSCCCYRFYYSQRCWVYFFFLSYVLVSILTRLRWWAVVFLFQCARRRKMFTIYNYYLSTKKVQTTRIWCSFTFYKKKKTNSRNKCLQSNVLLTENLANTPNS